MNGCTHGKQLAINIYANEKVHKIFALVETHFKGASLIFTPAGFNACHIGRQSGLKKKGAISFLVREGNGFQRIYRVTSDILSRSVVAWFKLVNASCPMNIAIL